jgi:hypothetical protein
MEGYSSTGAAVPAQLLSRKGRPESMSEEVLKLGQKVPDFELNTYNPAEDKFGKFSIANQIARKRWTVLFFYPADFTFV